MTTKRITAKDVSSITDLDVAFGTTQFLPPMDSIPKEYLSGSNIYVQVVEAIFSGSAFPDAELTPVEGVSPEGLNKIIRAHVSSWEPKHEHKIAGVAYLLSQLCEITPRAENQPEQPPKAAA
jgi:hypothetical protein